MQRQKLRALLAVDDVRNLFVQPVPVLGRQRLFSLVDAPDAATGGKPAGERDEKNKRKRRERTTVLLETWVPGELVRWGEKTKRRKAGGLPPPV